MTAFGGQVALLSLLNRETVERRGWLTADDITEAFTYTKLLPGPVVVQVVAYLGYRMRGVPGVLVATLLFLLPSVVAMLLLGVIYRRISSAAGVTAAFGGLTAGVVGIVLMATWGQACKGITDAVSAAVALLVCVAAVVWNTNPALLVLAAGLIGIAREYHKPRPVPENAAP